MGRVWYANIYINGVYWRIVASDDEGVRIHIRIPQELAKKLDYARQLNGGVSRSVVCRLALSRFLQSSALFAPVQKNNGNGWEPVPFDDRESQTGGETKRHLDNPEARAAYNLRKKTRGEE